MLTDPHDSVGLQGSRQGKELQALLQRRHALVWDMLPSWLDGSSRWFQGPSNQNDPWDLVGAQTLHTQQHERR